MYHQVCRGEEREAAGLVAVIVIKHYLSVHRAASLFHLLCLLLKRL